VTSLAAAYPPRDGQPTTASTNAKATAEAETSESAIHPGYPARPAESLRPDQLTTAADA
jgi:hypothetical protein